MLNGTLLGCLFAFVVWCVYEAVVQYKWTREMKTLEAMHMKNMANLKVPWMRWRSSIRPLFWEQQYMSDVLKAALRSKQ